MKKEWNIPEIEYISFDNTESGGRRSDGMDYNWIDNPTSGSMISFGQS